MRRAVIIDNSNCRRMFGVLSTSGAARLNSVFASRYADALCGSARKAAALAAALLFIALLAHCLELRAELLFRTAQPVDGQQRWSELRKYHAASHAYASPVLGEDAGAVAQEVQVIVSGFITAEDVTGAKVMQDLVKSGRQKIAGNLVSFSSSGGEFDAALELGRLLRTLGVSTMVGRDDQCLSSCVFAFMGGDRRIAAGRIGIHRPYFSSTRYVLDRRSQYRQLQLKLREYIEELDFPPSLYEEVMAVSSETIRVLSAADLKRYYLEGMSPSAQEEADAESARHLGIPILEFLQRKARDCSGAQARACAPVAASAPQRRALDPHSGTAGGALGLGAARSPEDSAQGGLDPEWH